MNSIKGITGIPSTQCTQNILSVLVIALKDRLNCGFSKIREKSQKLEYGAILSSLNVVVNFRGGGGGTSLIFYETFFHRWQLTNKLRP